MEFTIIDKDEKEIKCEIVFTFRDNNNDINYIVYTDGTKNKLGEEEIYASRYVVENGNYILKDIENDYEWNLIDNMIESKFNEVDI
jgi:uncharacterized protein YrzB (UPF0473 family)